MKTLQIIGIIAICIFLVAYIGCKAIDWFVSPGSIKDKIVDILSYVASGSLAVAATLGVICLFF